jgi:hypothetical protein
MLNRPITARQNLILELKEIAIQMTSNLICIVFGYKENNKSLFIGRFIMSRYQNPLYDPLWQN